MQAGNWEDIHVAKRPSPKTAQTVEQAEFEEFPALPLGEVPLPQAALGPRQEPDWDLQNNPYPITEKEPTTAPPLFPGGEADLETIPEIKPSESAFDPPVQIPSGESPF
jgi:hypothetical protein